MTVPMAADCEHLVDYVCARTGLSFAGSGADRLREAVSRACATPPGPRHPGQAQAMDEETFDRICDSITIRESFFFRERAKLAWLREHVLIPSRSRHTFRAWSAGCATGEEAYTLAMLLAEAGLCGRYSVLGTDLSAAAVTAARVATYGRWSLRGLTAATVAKFFWEDEAGFHVRDKFITGVTFQQHNLLDPPLSGFGRFDLILCRNVLIYLTPKAVARATKTLVDALAPGGFLLVGASDPLLDGVDGLDVVFTGHGLAYRRRGHHDLGVPPRTGRGQPAQPVKRLRRSPTDSRGARPDADLPALLAAGQRALERAQPRQAELFARRALEVSAAEPVAHRVLIQALAENGRLRDAIEMAELAVAAFPADALLRRLHAVVLLESGDPAGSAAAARLAVYLDPRDATAHLVLARGQELVGDHAGAGRTRRHGRRLLSRQLPR